MTQKQREERAVKYIIFGNFIAILAGIWVYVATSSQALFLDAFFSAIALLSSVAALVISKASKIRTKHYPDGIHFLEPLYSVLKSLLTLVLLVYSVYSVSAGALNYWVNGEGEPFTIGPVVPYALAMVAQCFLAAFLIHRENRKMNFTSTILSAESKTCYVDGLQSLGIGIAVCALYFIDINGKLGFLHYTGDFFVTVILVLFSIKEPVQVLVNGFRELTGGTTSDQEMTDAVHAAVASVCDGSVTICRKDIIKTGMYLHIRLYPSDPPKDEWMQEAKRKIKKELEQKYENIEIVFCK